MQKGSADAVAVEARDIVRRAAGDTNGLIVSAQIRKSARALGYPAENWRVREAWYGRADGWGAATVDDLRERFAAWRGREQLQAASGSGCSSPTLAHRVEAIRLGLARLSEQVDELAAEISHSDA